MHRRYTRGHPQLYRAADGACARSRAPTPLPLPHPTHPSPLRTTGASDYGVLVVIERLPTLTLHTDETPSPAFAFAWIYRRATPTPAHNSIAPQSVPSRFSKRGVAAITSSSYMCPVYRTSEATEATGATEATEAMEVTEASFEASATALSSDVRVELSSDVRVESG